MGNFRGGNRSQGGGGGWGGKKSFGSRGGDRGFDGPQMHEATCGDCGKKCEVPFKPSGSKPVYCRDCFKKDDGGDRRDFDKPRFDKPRYDKPQFDRPRFDKPRQESSFYEKPSRVQVVGESYDVQFKNLNKKLDAIMELLQKKEVQAIHMPEVKQPEEIVVAKVKKIAAKKTPATKKKKA